MGGVIGGMVGASEGQANRNAAEDARRQALAQYLGISAPGIAEQQLNFQQYQNAGDLVNQLEQAQQLGPSAMTGIQTDPRLLQAQMSALQQLSQTGQMGMTPAEAAALAQSNRDAQSMAQSKSQQILDNMARRGMGGSGSELAAQLQNAQSSADRASQQNNQIAQNAQQNALAAIAQSGNLAGNISGQQFGQKSDIARAKDYINQFNTQNSQNVSNTNVQANNATALRNLMNQQNLMNQNTQLNNQQQQYNKQLLQQQFNNQMALASGRAGQYQGIAQQQNQNAANTANMWAGIGQGVDTGAGALYNAYQKNGQGGGGLESSFDAMPGQYSNGYDAGGNMSQYNSPQWGAQAGGAADLEDFTTFV